MSYIAIFLKQTVITALYANISVGKFRPQQSISSSNGLRITISPAYHSLREQVGDTIIFFKEVRELEALKYNHNIYQY